MYNAELLMTDLSFDEDGREQKIGDGTRLIEAAKRLQPELKVLVFSAESNPVVVDGLFKRQTINGYAIEAISKNKNISLLNSSRLSGTKTPLTLPSMTL